MRTPRSTALIIVAWVAALFAGAALAIWQAPTANWDLPLLGLLLGFAIFSDLTAFKTPGHLKASGSFLALVLAMVLLGGTPAAIVGTLTICFGWLRWRDPLHYFLNNLVTYMFFPLVGGVVFHEVAQGAGLDSGDASYYVLILGVFGLALILNFVMIALYRAYMDRSSYWEMVRTAFFPVLPSELAAALMAAGVAFLYAEVGLAAIALFGVVLLTFQYLLGQLLLSQERAEQLTSRTKQLVSFQVGMLSALMKTLDLRDEMTARHCASVARYARAIARESGMSQSDQELVHIAGLVHDIGKFILPDHILKANVPLSDDDWNLIKMHPQQGANVVSSLEGYGPVAKIVLAHHERIDGKGYPRGLKGDQIPEMSRIISVADTYDVMTARDSYKEPVSSFEAIQELQRVAGAQLDERFVRIFVEEVLEGKDLTFRHGEDADFDVELALEERIAAVEEQSGRFLVGGARVG
jgi:putative nucleotidyltransferase with HDIG domain